MTYLYRFRFTLVPRWNKVLRPGLHKGPWTEEEDSIVRECVELSGAQKVRYVRSEYSHTHGAAADRESRRV